VAVAPHPGAVVAKKVRSGSLTLTWVGIVPVVPWYSYKIVINEDFSCVLAVVCCIGGQQTWRLLTDTNATLHGYF
jgi:hypothetical protein